MTDRVGESGQTPALPDFAVIADYLVARVDRCTCDGPFETYGHRPECGYEPVVALDELAEVLARAGRTVLEQAATDEQWFVFYGGSDPDNAAGLELRDDEVDAREHLRWLNAAEGAGLARRAVCYGAWEIVEFADGRRASESSGDGENRG
jgi:hypothetical protein